SGRACRADCATLNVQSQTDRVLKPYRPFDPQVESPVRGKASLRLNQETATRKKDRRSGTGFQESVVTHQAVLKGSTNRIPMARRSVVVKPSGLWRSNAVHDVTCDAIVCPNTELVCAAECCEKATVASES